MNEGGNRHEKPRPLGFGLLGHTVLQRRRSLHAQSIPSAPSHPYTLEYPPQVRSPGRGRSPVLPVLPAHSRAPSARVNASNQRMLTVDSTVYVWYNASGCRALTLASPRSPPDNGARRHLGKGNTMQQSSTSTTPSITSTSVDVTNVTQCYTLESAPSVTPQAQPPSDHP